MKANNFDYKKAAENLKRIINHEFGNNSFVKLPIWTVLESCSSSGMTRVIKAYFIVKSTPICIGRGRVKGCGMDMGFHVAYEIFCTAFPELPYQEFLFHGWL